MGLVRMIKFILHPVGSIKNNIYLFKIIHKFNKYDVNIYIKTYLDRKTFLAILNMIESELKIYGINKPKYNGFNHVIVAGFLQKYFHADILQKEQINEEEPYIVDLCDSLECNEHKNIAAKAFKSRKIRKKDVFDYFEISTQLCCILIPQLTARIERLQHLPVHLLN